MSFENDLLQGDRGEQAIARLLGAKGMSEIAITSGNTPEYDISCVSPSGNRVTYEVKTDYYYDTGNMAIEFFCLRRWKPTGILASTADWYVYIYDQKREAYFIKREALLEILTKPDKGSVVNGGDDNQSVMFKLPRHRLHDKATVIDINSYLK